MNLLWAAAGAARGRRNVTEVAVLIADLDRCHK
jgi:hypothetical protein